MYPLSNQLAVITGASSGIGRAIAIAIAEIGGGVILLGRDKINLDETQRRISKLAGTHSDSYVCDLSSVDDILNKTAEIKAKNKNIDILIHSAGVIVTDGNASSSYDEFDLQYKINARGPYILTRAFLSSIQERLGQIVFINSSVCMQPAKIGFAAYTASKMALKAVADCIRAEVNEAGVRVLSVYPGSTASPMQAKLHQAHDKSYFPEHLLQPEDVARAVITALTASRTAEITDLAIRPAKKLADK